MSSERRTERDEVLAELLWLRPEDPERRRVLGEDPSLIAELAELEASAARWTETASSELAALSAAALEPRSADRGLEDRALEALRGSIARTAPAGAVRRRRRWIWLATALAAAAAVLVLVDGPGRGGERAAGGPVFLGEPDDAADCAPVGRVERIESFRWRAAPSPGSVQRVRLWYAGADEGPPSLESGPLTVPEWTPPPGVLEALGPQFRWAVYEQNPISGEQRRILEARVRVGG